MSNLFRLTNARMERLKPVSARVLQVTPDRLRSSADAMDVGISGRGLQGALHLRIDGAAVSAAVEFFSYPVVTFFLCRANCTIVPLRAPCLIGTVGVVSWPR